MISHVNRPGMNFTFDNINSPEPDDRLKLSPTASILSMGSNKKGKNVPSELTSYGTTPSGKPRLFVCQVCTRAFARLEHLRRHERSHTKEKPFSCGVCQRKFSRRDLLLRHAQKLHAGCADAITRLRRKLIKRSGSVSSTSTLLAEYEDKDDMDVDDKDKKKYDSVQFNLNLFNHNLASKSQRLSRLNSVKDSSSVGSTPLNLQRHVFDRRKMGRSRGASFSAQSGANYAIGLPEFNDSYPGADNVEFSTPQLLPTSLGDELSWLNNLSSIPGLGDSANSPYAAMQDALTRQSKSPNHPRNSSISSISLENSNSHNNEIPHYLNHQNSLLMPGQANDIPTLLSFDSMSNMQYMMPTATISQNEMAQLLKNAKPKDSDSYGYSFYDIPDLMLLRSGNDNFKFPHPLSPIKQLDDEEMTSSPPAKPAANSITTNGVNFDLNFLYDIDEITQELDLSSKFMTGGYSFYGDNPLVLSSGVELSNSPRIASPIPTANRHTSLADDVSVNPNFLNQTQIMNIQGKKQKLTNYSKSKLFTSNMRYMISKSLSKYPISGIMTPTIPSNEKLEFYLSTFTLVFLSHFPFIHKAKLNEYEIMNMTVNEDPANESARVCLPLLVATIGALLVNQKNDLEHLYEASRRIIHIYLESRKNNNTEGLPSQAVNPLWLIQSLTLLVIYGLFSDNENNVYVVIRQLNALNSLVKTSIKSNRKVAFSISGEDEDILSTLKDHADSSLFGNNSFITDELKFRNNINVQSQLRIVFMIYRLTNFLLMMYNVPLTLSINDLDNVTLPTVKDEFLWTFDSYASFNEYVGAHHLGKSLDDFLSTDRIVYKDLLFLLTKTQFEKTDMSHLSGTLGNLSKFGCIALIDGIFEIKQYDDKKTVDVFSILDNLTVYIDNQTSFSIEGTRTSTDDFEKLDYALLLSFIKVSSLVDFRLVKEQSWLRNFDELTKNYHNFLNSLENFDEFDYLRTVDCCILIVKLVLFKTDDENADNKELFHTELNYFKAHHSFNSMVNELLRKSPGTFEQAMNLKIYDEIDNSKNSIHSQMLFHAFTILSVFAVSVAKKNRERSAGPLLKELNQRFVVVLKLLSKIEQFLKLKYQNSKLENDFTNLNLFSTMGLNEDDLYNNTAGDGERHVAEASKNNCFDYTLEKALYILKLGELVLSYMYDTNIKVSIFKKLSDSLSQIRKYLIDNESRVLG